MRIGHREGDAGRRAFRRRDFGGFRKTAARHLRQHPHSGHPDEAIWRSEGCSDRFRQFIKSRRIGAEGGFQGGPLHKRDTILQQGRKQGNRRIIRAGASQRPGEAGPNRGQRGAHNAVRRLRIEPLEPLRQNFNRPNPPRHQFRSSTTTFCSADAPIRSAIGSHFARDQADNGWGASRHWAIRSFGAGGGDSMRSAR